MTAKGAYQGNGKYQKQEFKRTLALCPRCNQYMGSIRADCQVIGLKTTKALPIKYCFRCNLVMVLDMTIPIVYQIHTTEIDAKTKIKQKKFVQRNQTKAKIINHFYK